MKLKFFLLVFFYSINSNGEGKTIYFFPWAHESDFFKCPYCYDLKAKFLKFGFHVKAIYSFAHELPDFAGLITFHVPRNPQELKMLERYTQEKKVLILFEPPAVAPHYYDPLAHQYFGKIFIMLDNYVDNKKYFKLLFPKDLFNQAKQTVKFNEKKLCTAVFSNKSSGHPDELYSLRRAIIKFFEAHAPTEFDLYGQSWSQAEFPSYKGSIDSKAILAQYKFCIAYENMRSVGYITEKIFDVFVEGIVPVYYGARNICEYIPKECFVWREDFVSDRELYNFLKNMPEEKYKMYLEAIQNFMKSEKSKIFAEKHFVDQIFQALTT